MTTPESLGLTRPSGDDYIKQGDEAISQNALAVAKIYDTLTAADAEQEGQLRAAAEALEEMETALPYRGLWEGGGDMDTWRAGMRGTWEVRDSAAYPRPANFPPNVPATVTSLVTVDTTAGGHTVHTVKPTGTGQAIWFRASKSYTGTGSTNWSAWRRSDSVLRSRLADGTNLDSLRTQADEGATSITQAQALTLTGLPEPGAFGTLQVIPSLDGLAAQFFHQLTRGGGATRLWWRLINHATAFTFGPWQLLTPEPGAEAVTVPIVLTTGGGPASTTTETAVHARVPVNIPARATEWRVHFRNYNYRDAKPYTGSLAFAGVVFGPGAVDAAGRPNGQYAAPPASILGPTATPADAGEFTTPWVKTNPIEAGSEYLLAYAYTAPAGQLSYLAVGGGWRGSDPAALTDTAPSLVQEKYMPLDVWLEIKTAAGTEVVAYYGDSLTAGLSADLPVYDSYPMRHARAAGHLPIIYAASGSAMNLWTNPNSGQLTRWQSFTKPSRVYWSMGSNDIFQPADIATIRQRFAAAWPVVTAATSRNVILTTILPRLNATAPAEAVRQEWNRILQDELPGNAQMCIDTAAALSDDSGAVLDPRWRAAPTDIHLSKAGYARFAAQL